MSAIRPNRNFDNETAVHTPYSEIVKQHVTHERGHLINTQPIRTNNTANRNLDIRNSQSVRDVYNKFFK